MFDMKENYENIMNICDKCGADKTAIVKLGAIEFSMEFRNLCKSNSCGRYGTNWMCPPGVGEIDDQIAILKPYKKAVMIQTIGQLEDSFDVEGWGMALSRHTSVLNDIRSELTKLLPDSKIMYLSAGACNICERCTFLDNEPCCLPELAIPPIESFGIDVYKVLSASGLKYNNGINTVSYVGMVLFDYQA